jgi:dienelactone hydrolase
MAVRGGLALLLVAFAAELSACGGSSSGHIGLSVRPTDAPVDRVVAIRVSGAPANSRVTLVATAQDAFGHPWRSQATFVADRRGEVDVTRDPSLAGTYKGRDAMGLFWSMHEVGSQIPVNEQYMRLPNVLQVRISVLVGGRTTASRTLSRVLRPPGVRLQEETLAKQGFIGCFWSPQHSQQPAPAILEFGGSEGGLDCGLGLLAAHGYPELRLGYFSLPGLPRYLERIPLAYFAQALRWLARQPGVDPRRIVISGASRGAEAAILTAAAYPSLVHAAVEYVGSALTLSSNGLQRGATAWTLRGQPIPAGRPLPVWKVNGPLLLIGGDADLLTASGYAAQDMAATLRAHGRHDFTLLEYKNAGHGLASGLPYAPFGADVGANMGGTFAGDARAREDSWQKLLVFLGKLKRG